MLHRALLALAAASPLAAHAQPVRMLFLGNSYTGVNNLPALVEQVATSLGDTTVASANMPGGYTFAQHSTNATSLSLIHAQPWDFTVLQEQSQLPSFPQGQVDTDVMPYATALVDLVRANDSCTTPVFYMTWGRQGGDPQNCANWPPVCTYAGMQALLRQRYLQMAADNQAECAPAGAVWSYVRTLYPGLNLYAADGSHPSMAGSYLVACTMYATCFRRSPAGAYHPPAIHPDTAAILQQAAALVVLDSLSTWNIGVLDPDPGLTWNDLGGGQVQFTATNTTATDHGWNFGDGGTSTLGAPAHTYGTPGPFTVTHRVTDACGRTDSVQVTILLNGTGIHGPDGPGPRAWCADNMFHLAPPMPGELLLVRSDGALLRKTRTSSTGLEHVPLNGLSGPVIWRFTGSDGRQWAGRTACP